MGPPEGRNLSSSERQAASDKRRLMDKQKGQKRERMNQRVKANDTLRREQGLHSREEHTQQMLQQPLEPVFKKPGPEDADVSDPGSPGSDLAYTDPDEYDEQFKDHAGAQSTNDTTKNLRFENWSNRVPGKCEAAHLTFDQAEDIRERSGQFTLQNQKNSDVNRESRSGTPRPDKAREGRG